MSSALSPFYQKFCAQLESLAAAYPNRTPTLLLHSCCGPCSSAVLELLLPHFAVTIFYYNPNIYPRAEYERRRDEQLRFVHEFCGGTVPVIESPYQTEDFYESIRHIENYETEREPGERCRACYELRLRATARYAQAHGFDFFTTTLSISPHKDARKINAIGEQVQNELCAQTGTAGVGVLGASSWQAGTVSANALDAAYADESGAAQKTCTYLYADFKKKNGFKRSLELSAQYGLYRQEYCGCVYSYREAAARNTENKA